MYHGGVWAIDLSTPEKLTLPRAVGAFLPANVSPKPPTATGADLVGTPNVLEALPTRDGDLVVFDSQSGVYVVRFDATMPVEGATPWPGSELE